MARSAVAGFAVVALCADSVGGGSVESAVARMGLARLAVGLGLRWRSVCGGLCSRLSNLWGQEPASFLASQCRRFFWKFGNGVRRQGRCLLVESKQHDRYIKLGFSSVYAYPSDFDRTNKLVTNLFQELHLLGLPFLCLGDWQEEASDIF